VNSDDSHTKYSIAQLSQTLESSTKYLTNVSDDVVLVGSKALEGLGEQLADHTDCHGTTFLFDEVVGISSGKIHLRLYYKIKQLGIVFRISVYRKTSISPTWRSIFQPFI